MGGEILVDKKGNMGKVRRALREKGAGRKNDALSCLSMTVCYSDHF